MNTEKKCPYCNESNEAQSFGYFECSNCAKWYSINDKPKEKSTSELNTSNFLDEEELDENHKAFKYKKHRI